MVDICKPELIFSRSSTPRIVVEVFEGPISSKGSLVMRHVGTANPDVIGFLVNRVSSQTLSYLCSGYVDSSPVVFSAKEARSIVFRVVPRPISSG